MNYPLDWCPQLHWGFLFTICYSFDGKPMWRLEEDLDPCQDVPF